MCVEEIARVSACEKVIKRDGGRNFDEHVVIHYQHCSADYVKARVCDFRGRRACCGRMPANGAVDDKMVGKEKADSEG